MVFEKKIADIARILPPCRPSFRRPAAKKRKKILSELEKTDLCRIVKGKSFYPVV